MDIKTHGGEMMGVIGKVGSTIEECRIPEFPAKFPENVDKPVIVSKDFQVYEITRIIEKGFLKIPAEYSFLGQLFWSIEIHDLLQKFGEKFYQPHPDYSILAGYVIKFKTLLAGYRLSNSREFYRVFESAQTEEEFCALAGVS